MTLVVGACDTGPQRAEPYCTKTLKDRGRGNLRQGRRLPRPQRSEENRQAVLRLYNPARMHVSTVLPDKYIAMVGEQGGKDWGVTDPCANRAGIRCARGKTAAPPNAVTAAPPQAGKEVWDRGLSVREHRHRRRPRTGPFLLDAACHRVLLADPLLHRVLCAAAAGRRRPSLQRQDGPRRLPSTAGLLD